MDNKKIEKGDTVKIIGHTRGFRHHFRIGDIVKVIYIYEGSTFDIEAKDWFGLEQSLILDDVELYKKGKI